MAQTLTTHHSSILATTAYWQEAQARSGVGLEYCTAPREACTAELGPDIAADEI